LTLSLCCNKTIKVSGKWLVVSGQSLIELSGSY
jgi:hypothetical protein